MWFVISQYSFNEERIILYLTKKVKRSLIKHFEETINMFTSGSV